MGNKPTSSSPDGKGKQSANNAGTGNVKSGIPKPPVSSSANVNAASSKPVANGNNTNTAAATAATTKSPTTTNGGGGLLARRNTGDSIRQIINKGSVNTNYLVRSDVVLGKGHYAIVNLAVDRRTNKEVALKRIQISKSRTEALKAEIEVLMKVGHHPNIVALYDIFITDTEVQLVMELLRGGELFDRMVDKGPYSELEASQHIGKIGHALKFLHSKGIVHRDLKPENLILVDKSDHAELKIADFGLSKIVDDIENSTMQTICGTWAYAAPEVKTSVGASGSSAYSYKVDLWSTGVIMFVILAAYHPFDPEGDCSDAQLWSNICKGAFDFNDPAWDQISDSAKDLIKHLIVVDPAKRYSIDQLLAHPWVAHVGVSVPMTPITPRIDTNLRTFQNKKKYQPGFTPRVGGGPRVADPDEGMEVDEDEE